MKMAIFTDTFYPDINGVARTLKRLTDYLHKQKISFKVFAPKSTGENEYVSENIHRFEGLSFFLYPECRLALPKPKQINKELQAFSPDLIHVATPFNMGLCGIYYAKKLNIPLVGSFHTDFEQYLSYYELPFLSKIIWKYMYWFHQPFEKLFVPSQDTYEKLKGQHFRNLEIWPRGVDCQHFHPHHSERTVREKYRINKRYILTYVGRLAPEKDLMTLMSIAKGLPENFRKHIQWIIAGDGPLRKNLEHEAPENMIFTGYLSGVQLAEIYSVSDLFVFPSPTETFGNVVLEALASGTPVIGSNSGGVKNIISQGNTGILCQPGAVEQFIHAIVHLLSHDRERWQMALEGRKYALSQKWDNIFEHLIRQYTDVIIKNKKYA
jgi:glycosyltransferase involved in cell wall biosynthesis